MNKQVQSQPILIYSPLILSVLRFYYCTVNILIIHVNEMDDNQGRQSLALCYKGKLIPPVSAGLMELMY